MSPACYGLDPTSSARERNGRRSGFLGSTLRGRMKGDYLSATTGTPDRKVALFTISGGGSRGEQRQPRIDQLISAGA